jgi:hypothetical protein
VLQFGFGRVVTTISRLLIDKCRYVDFSSTNDAEYFSVLEELYRSSSVVLGELPRDTEIIALLKAESATNILQVLARQLLPRLCFKNDHRRSFFPQHAELLFLQPSFEQQSLDSERIRPDVAGRSLCKRTESGFGTARKRKRNYFIQN